MDLPGIDLFDGWPIAIVAILVVVLVALVAVAVALFVRLLGTYRMIRSSSLPIGGKVAFWATVAYFLSPIDLLPDPVVLDDIAALVATLTYVNNLARQHGLIDTDDSDQP
jgi:uncharacterized membrane protein YkvA (DUF1232 family)